MNDMIAAMNEIVARYNDGGYVVVSEDDSAFIKRFFDAFHPEHTEEGRVVSSAFFLECEEWWDETERGLR